MAHLGGMYNPSSRFSLGSSVLEFWMQGGEELARQEEEQSLGADRNKNGQSCRTRSSRNSLPGQAKLSLLRNVAENVMASVW